MHQLSTLRSHSIRVSRMQSGAQQSVKKSKLVELPSRLEDEILKKMNVPEQEIKWARKELEEFMSRDANLDKSCRQLHFPKIKQLIAAKIITDLNSVHPNQVVEGGPMQVAVQAAMLRQKALPEKDAGRTLFGTAKALMNAACKLSTFLIKSWALQKLPVEVEPAAPGEAEQAPQPLSEQQGASLTPIRAPSKEAGVLREPTHERPVRTDSIDPPHRSHGSRRGPPGPGGDESGLLRQHVGCERRARGLTVGGGRQRTGREDGGATCGGATCGGAQRIALCRGIGFGLMLRSDYKRTFVVRAACFWKVLFLCRVVADGGGRPRTSDVRSGSSQSSV